MTEKYLSVKEVAERTGTTRGNIYKLLASHPLEADVMIGDVRGWKPETVDAWRASIPEQGGWERTTKGK